MNRFARPLIAALAAVLAVLIAHWFDARVLADAEREGTQTFNSSLFFYLTPIAHVLTAAGVVGLALVAWWSRSLLLGVAYAVAGGAIVFLPAFVQAFATGANDTPPIAPEPIASTLWSWFVTVGAGVTGVVFTLGAAMLLSGLAVIVRMLRRSPMSVAAAPEVAAQPA
ncbi:MAG TPA: hypothetical protein VF323_13850 [Candidatus Limnocylindrales bacterium]